MHSQWVDEVFADDAELRKKMKVIIRRHMLVDEEIDAEVRQRIKNLQEGSTAWDVEYAKVMEQIKAEARFEGVDAPGPHSRLALTSGC